MGKKPNKELLFPPERQDRLIQLAQENDESAWKELLDLHLSKMKSYAFVVIPEYAHCVQDADLQPAFFKAIHSAVVSFKPGNRRFESYFLSIFKHELIKVLDDYGYFNPGRVISLEEPVFEKDGTALIFADFIHVEEDFFSYEVAIINRITKEICEILNDDQAVKIAEMRRQKMTFERIAKYLGISVKTAWDKFQKYLTVAKRVVGRFF